MKFDPKPLYPAEHFVVVLPKSMHFAAAPGVPDFKSMNDPNNADTIVQVAQQTHAGQALGFTISGTGTISDQPAGGGAQAGAQSGPQSGPMNENPQTESSRPGGGLGAPIDAPDPLEKYRWYDNRRVHPPAGQSADGSSRGVKAPCPPHRDRARRSLPVRWPPPSPAPEPSRISGAGTMASLPHFARSQPGNLEIRNDPRSPERRTIPTRS